MKSKRIASCLGQLLAAGIFSSGCGSGEETEPLLPDASAMSPRPAMPPRIDFPEPCNAPPCYICIYHGGRVFAMGRIPGCLVSSGNVDLTSTTSTTTYNDIAPTGTANEYWAVGDNLTIVRVVYSNPSRTPGGVLQWQPVRSGGAGRFLAVASTGPRNAWAVGDSGTIYAWKGTRWSPSASGTTATLRGVYAASTTSAWAVGDAGTILFWNGGRWAPVRSGVTAGLRSIAGASATDIWAVGDAGTSVHWDGKTWTSVPTPTANALYRVRMLGFSARAVGERGTSLLWDPGSSRGMQWADKSTPAGIDTVLWDIKDGAVNWAIGSSGFFALWTDGTRARLAGGGNAMTPLPSYDNSQGHTVDQVLTVGKDGLATVGYAEFPR